MEEMLRNGLIGPRLRLCIIPDSPADRYGRRATSKRSKGEKFAAGPLLPSFPGFAGDFFVCPRVQANWNPMVRRNAQREMASRENDANEIARLLVFSVFQRQRSSDGRRIKS